MPSRHGSVDARPAKRPGLTGDWDRVITRRTLLKTGGSFAAVAAMAGWTAPDASAFPLPERYGRKPIDGYPFTLGVASGDPSPHSVVLWTRLVPNPLVVGGGMRPERYGVRYEVALDEGFRRVIRRGTVPAVPDEAHSARTEIHDLSAAHEYFYRFKAGREISPVGRTRTAPEVGAAIESLRFAFVSCQNFSDGYFTPYADVVAQDLDAVIHLGDYIYEGRVADVRAHEPPREVRTLDDYRIRHGQYKTDLDLQAAHAALPWLVTWDDHEVENNYADMDSDPDTPPEEFAARRAAAYRAYWEHMPLRRVRKPDGPFFHLFRRFIWGTMATFNVLDTRQYRSDQPTACAADQRDPSGYCASALAPERTMLGAEQRDWLFEDLATTSTRWNVIAQQTALAPLDRDPNPDVREFGGGDNWEGYVAERQQLLDLLVARGTPNPIVITGDSHQSWVRNVPPNHTDYDAPPVATEFMGTSISTNGDPLRPTTRFQDDPENPHILLRDNRRGYVCCTLTADAWISDYRIVPTVRQRGVEAATLVTFAVESGRAGAQQVGAPPV
jgi:alkaline phosphatase D